MVEQDFEFAVSGYGFRGRKMNAFDQSKALKRVMPIVKSLVPLFTELADAAPEGKEAAAVLIQLAGPFFNSFADLPDADLEWLMLKACQGLEIHRDKRWAPFWSSRANEPMFKDLNDAAYMLPITVEVIRANLTPFFNELVTRVMSLRAEKEASAAPNGEDSLTVRTG